MVNKASDLNGRYGPEAQYIVVPSPIYASTYPGIEHKHLCGHLSAAAIYETWAGKTNLVGAVWDNVQTAPYKGYATSWLSSSGLRNSSRALKSATWHSQIKLLSSNEKQSSSNIYWIYKKSVKMQTITPYIAISQ